MSVIATPVLKGLVGQIEEKNTAYRWLDLYAAEFVVKGLLDAEKEYANDIALLICQLSYASSKSKICLSANELDLDLALVKKLSIVDVNDHNDAKLQTSASPLVVHGHDIYLCRYWNLKCEFEGWLSERLAHENELDEGLMRDLGAKLQSVFKLNHPESPTEINWQGVAAAHALLQNTTFIAGGPGTGKTTTAASLLYLIDQSTRLRLDRSAKVRLLAPTGKAAVRLADSISTQLKRIEAEQDDTNDQTLALSSVLPDNGETIHRFLIDHKALPSQKRPNQLNAESLFLGKEATIKTDADILIIDESSMIDLALMVSLIKTVSLDTQIIFMGDPYQLPPVEPGEVFAQQVRRFEYTPYSTSFVEKLAVLTSYEREAFGLNDQNANMDKPLCYLRKTYRFCGDLKLAADQINAGNFAEFSCAFKETNDSVQQGKEVRWFSHNEAEANNKVIQQILSAYQEYFEAVKAKASVSELDKAFSQFQLLCSTHEGEQGVAAINTLIEQNLLASLGYNDIYDPANFLYHGKAILITKNHAELGVFNGDIGFVCRDDNSGSFRVVVPQGAGEDIIVSPLRLKAWLPAYAMTVHKSQGSEYKNVGLLLADYAKELLSRPLVYTGLTRAKECCDIWATEEALGRAFLSVEG